MYVCQQGPWENEMFHISGNPTCLNRMSNDDNNGNEQSLLAVEPQGQQKTTLADIRRSFNSAYLRITVTSYCRQGLLFFVQGLLAGFLNIHLIRTERENSLCLKPFFIAMRLVRYPATQVHSSMQITCLLPPATKHWAFEEVQDTRNVSSSFEAPKQTGSRYWDNCLKAI